MREALTAVREMETERREIPDWGRTRVQARVQQILGQKSPYLSEFWARIVLWATCTASVAVGLILLAVLYPLGRTPSILVASATSALRSVTPVVEIAWFDTSWFNRPSTSLLDDEVHILQDVFPGSGIQSIYTHRSLDNWLNQWPDDGVKVICGHPHWVGTAADKITVKGRWRGNAFEKEFVVSDNDLRRALSAARDYIEDQAK